MPPPPPQTESSMGSRTMRPQRPLLPRIDPTVGFRPPVLHGELTPASSGHSSLISPVSATSGPRSPGPAIRKASIPGPRRPPSPELTNLDCAFPPFPLPSRAATTRKRERSATHRSDTKQPKSRDVHKGLPIGNRPYPLSREGSDNSVTTLVNEAPRRKQSRSPSPGTGGRRPRSTERVGHQQKGEKPPGIEPISPAVLSASQGDGVPEILHARTFTPEISNSDAQREPASGTKVDPGLSAFDFGGSETNKFKSQAVADAPRLIDERSRADTEPSYRTKRPPPLFSNQEVMTLVKSPTEPQPSPVGSLTRGLGRLFGRRRSQSAASRREVVRQALSDEPDIHDISFAGRSLVSPTSDRSFIAAEPSPLSISLSASPRPSLGHEESLKALEGLTPEPVAVAPPMVVVEPAIEDPPLKFTPSAETDNTKIPETTDVAVVSPDPQGAELIEVLRRVSVDSASSYGSVAFSENTASSRSSSPQTEHMASQASEPSNAGLLKPGEPDVPAPLRPKIPELSPDSPTDPFFQQGRLSPIPDLPNHASDSTGSLVSISVGLQTSPKSTDEPQASLGSSTKSTVPNKGVCRGCSQLILTGQKSVSSADGRLTGRYHKECFVCRACKIAFPTAEFYVHDDQPYCAHHYHELENSLCATCGKGIEGLYMETANVAGRGKEKHHPECLKCTTCKVRLDHDYFELSGKVYCERDAFRLATLPRAHDNAPSRPSPLVREYISSGDPGLVKGRNFPERRTTRLMTTT
ncbi:uncharacterized protein Z520_10445 [Fonsecaea multimorphosa CBS 102226]|uniref:LIM zinc-binding domain-containing protein n=1 Tax=Fonsecaea multimorphosa CBS 102226 TaxID=1442371 RepID=A0A0D2GW28_9EURO|nr:uncharacterized protein Z520_10445 [Fonsecaea multimorphosa CBS 102226]KIX93820.1 hypothetical protein Z520_10445 [Fonsecaea multimorphosa CBS 102226]OAL19060.1 hypothetical protein AYO22_10008 [Fonsecaea multimorphosa]